MRIAVIGADEQSSEHILPVLSRYAGDNRIRKMNSLQEFREFRSGDRTIEAAVVYGAESLSKEELSELMSSFPMTRFILVTDLIQLESSLSLYPVTVVSPDRVKEGIEQALNAGRPTELASEGTLVISWNKVLYTLAKNKISYLERNARNTWIYSDEKNLRCTANLDEMEQQMPDYFGRCHKSYLVNMFRIRQLSRNEAVLMDGTVIPVSRNRYEDFQKKYSSFLEKYNLTSKAV